MKKIGTKPLKTNRTSLILDSLEETLKIYDAGLRNKDACNKANWVYFETREEIIKLYEKNINFYQEDVFFWIIKDLSTNMGIGSIGIHTISEKDNSCEIGYNLHPDFWNNGIMSEVIPVIANYLINDAQFNRLVFKCTKDNIASQKALEKAGAKFEGIERSSRKFGDIYKDIYIYSILASDIDK